MPSPALRSHVESYWIFRGGSLPSPHRVLPDGCVDIVVRPGAPPVVSGISSRFHFAPTSSPWIAGIRFRPGGAHPWLRVPIVELREEAVLASRFAPDLEIEASDPRSALLALERHLLSVRQEWLPIDPAVTALVRRLASGRARIESIADELGIGSRQLRRKLDASVGLGPKSLDRLLRFRRLLEAARASRSRDWADLALQAGYYDQSHLVNEFTCFAGLSPEKYFAARSPVRFFQYAHLAAY